ncbi:adenylate/guanylate cyclase domain-containing protein [Spiribacter sp. 221]|uniref:adenylate/guanylate cyclase domain-containing protein n=1 Tax=Spiribacter onubensis TaxID=3122420 RepID=UPI00349F9DD8
MESLGDYRYRPATPLYAYRQSWFSRYLSPPVRELLDAGPLAERALRSPRHANVCILFTDIRGFTELSRSMDPVVLIGTVDRCIGRQARVVECHGGYVDNFTGDGLMAVFEGCSAEESACRCALEIVERPEGVRVDRTDDPVPIGAGLHSGDVVMGSIGCESRLTYTTVGETVNVAARLSGRAAGCDVVISEPVRAALPGATARRFRHLPGPAPAGLDPAMALYRAEPR